MALSLAVLAGACSDDAGDTNPTPNPDMTPDMNPMPNPDMNPGMNPDANPDPNPDMNPEPNPDANPDPMPECGDGTCDEGEDSENCPEDCGLPDRDEDGVADGDDNCPDDPNEDQFDSDGDGFGEECDTCPLVENPDNDPAICAPQDEGEPNDGFVNEGWTLPMFVEGNVGEVIGGVADQDIFTLTLLPGQTVRARLSTESTNLQAAMIVVGIDFENQEFVRILINPDVATTNEREIFFTRPGRYSFVVSDLRNFIEQFENVGGEDYNYLFEMAEFELTEIEALPNLPFTDRPLFDEKLHVYSFPASGQDFIEAEAQGQAFDQVSLLLPGMTLWDPNTNSLLAETVVDDVLDDRSVSMSALTPGDGEVWLIVDAIQGQGSAATNLTITPEVVEGEVEPNNSEDLASPFVVPGSLTARIDLPTPDPNTQRLIPDEDFYIFGGTAGDFFTFRAEKAEEGNDFDANLEIGRLGRFGFFELLSINREAGDGDPNARADFLVPESGVYYMRVSEEANNNIGPDEDPVGGSGYEYTLSAEVAEIEIIDTITAPNEIAGALPGPGQQAFYELSGNAGDIVEVSTVPTSAIQSNLRAYDGESRELLGEDLNGRTFSVLIPESGTVLLQVGDRQGRGGPTFTFTLNTSVREIAQIDGFPFSDPDGVLLERGEMDLYAMTARAGVTYDVRVEHAGSRISLAEIALFDAENLSQSFTNTFNRNLPMRFDTDRNIVIRVRDLGGGGSAEHTYRFVVREVETERLELPFETSGVLEEPGAAAYYTIPYVAGQRQLIRIAEGGGLNSRILIYDLNRLTLVRTTNEIESLFTRNQTLDLLLIVSDNNNVGQEGFTFDLRVGPLEPEAIVPPFDESLQFEEPGQKLFYQFDAPADSVITVTTENQEGSLVNPRITLMRAEDLGFLEQSFGFPTLDDYIAEAGTFLLEITDLNENSGPQGAINVKINVVTPTAVQLPDTVEGTLPENGTPVFFKIDLTQAQLIRVGSGAEGFTPLVRAFVAQGFEEVDAVNAGLLFIPPRDGTYIFSIRDVVGGGGEGLDYTFTIEDVDQESLTTRDEVEPNDNVQVSNDLIEERELRIFGTLFPDNNEFRDTDFFPIELEAGDVVTALTTFGRSQASFDTVLRLVDANNFQLARDDNNGPQNYSIISGITVGAAGTYYLAVEPVGNGTGDYSLIVSVE